MVLGQDELRQPATLTLWSTEAGAPKAVEPQLLDSLSEALAIAADAMRDGDAVAWVITGSGLILSPSWLGAYLADTTDTPQMLQAAE